MGAGAGQRHRADPGTKRIKYLDDNLGAVRVSLTKEDLAQIDAVLPAPAGERYYAQAMKAIDS